MLKAEVLDRELTLDEVYLQNKRIIDAGRKQRAAEANQLSMMMETKLEKKPSFISRFGKEMMTLFFE